MRSRVPANLSLMASALKGRVRGQWPNSQYNLDFANRDSFGLANRFNEPKRSNNKLITLMCCNEWDEN